MTRSFPFAALMIVLIASIASAQDYTVGDITIDDPYARATAPKAPVAGGYMKIVNKGSQPDRLIGGQAAFAGKVEIHEMKMQGDVMKMRPLSDGLVIPPGGSVDLKPGGYHLMFMNLKTPLKAGEARDVTLTFEKAGKVDVTFDVRKFGRSAHGGSGKSGHSGHSGMTGHGK